MRLLLKIAIIITLFCSVPFLAAAQDRKLMLGASVNYYFASSEENSCLIIPNISNFNQMILSDPAIYQSISQGLGGEFMEVLSYDDYSGSRTPSIGILFGNLFVNGMYLQFMAQWMKGTHSRGFSAEYFSMESEQPEPVSGEFEANWSELDFLLGTGYATKTKVPVLIEGGALLVNKKYSNVEANIAGVRFEVSEAYKGLYPGFYISAGIQLLPKKPVSIDFKVHLNNWFKDGQMVTNPGVGVSVVWNIRQKSKKTEVIQIESINTAIPLMYYPPDYSRLFEGEEFPIPDQKMYSKVSDELFIGRVPSVLELYPGQEVELLINPEANPFVLYSDIHIHGKYDTFRIEPQSNLILSEPGISFTLPDSMNTGSYVAEIIYETDPSGIDTLRSPFIVTIEQEQLSEIMSGDELSFYSDFSMDIERLKRRGNGIKRKIDSLSHARDSIYWGAEDDSIRYMQLKELDRRLDHLPVYYKNKADQILDSLDKLESDYPGITDPAGLVQKVKDAEKAAEDCKEKTAALESELDKNNERCKKLKEEQDAILEKIHALFTENGFTGSYGYHPNGRYHYGYTGDENANTDFGNLPWEKEVARLKKDLKKLSKEYMECLETSNKLPEMIAENENRCAEMQEAIEKAKENQARGDVYQSLKDDLEQICDWSKKALKKLKEWCDANPEDCHFGDKIDELLKKDCPQNADEWDDFWNDIKDLLNDKKVLEDQLKKDSRNGWKKGDNIQDEIEDAVKEQNDNWDAIRILQEEKARRLREAKAAAQREERAAAERERKKMEELIGCLEKLAAWIQEHQDEINPDDTKKIMERITSGAGAAGQGAIEAAEKVAKGMGTSGAALSGVGVGALNLAAAILYMYAEHKMTVAANKVVDDHLKNRIEAEALLSKDNCGIINIGNRSYFYMKIDGKTIIFSITPNGFGVSTY
jgi:hypothetical protein